MECRVVEPWGEVPWNETSAGEREPVVGATVGINRKAAAGRMAFGRMLATALKERGLKQEDLAQSLGTTQSSVSGWINGKYEPSAATVFTIERALGLDPGLLSRPLGYLPVEPATRAISVEAAIAQCTTLDDDAKAAMSAIYRMLSERRGPAMAPERPNHQVSGSKRKRLAAPPASSELPRSMASGH